MFWRVIVYPRTNICFPSCTGKRGFHYTLGRTHQDNAITTKILQELDAGVSSLHIYHIIYRNDHQTSPTSTATHLLGGPSWAPICNLKHTVPTRCLMRLRSGFWLTLNDHEQRIASAIHAVVRRRSIIHTGEGYGELPLRAMLFRCCTPNPSSHHEMRLHNFKLIT
jgi:hypothetical protein